MTSFIKKIIRYPTSYVAQYRRKKVLRRIEAKKKERSQQPYHTHPEVTFIVQFFNKRENVHKIFEAIQSFDKAEIIVIDDGSVDGSYEEWMKLLTKPNHFLIRSNDLHEVITYDRALRMAKGKLACFLQDDDVPIASNWVQEAISLFEHHPKMIILGGKDGLDIKIPDIPKDESDNQYTITGDIASTPGVTKYRFFREPTHRCPATNIPFMFCTAINRAPMFVDVQAYLQLGGTDLSFAPFQCDDVDICIRAWKSGYKVGFYRALFKRNVNTGGMRLFNAGVVSQQAAKNWKKVYQLHGDFIASESHRVVEDANTSLLKNEEKNTHHRSEG